MNIFRILAGAIVLIMAGSIIWAWGEGHFLRELEVMLAMPWGLVTLIDLYAGFVLLSIVILAIERKWWLALAWIAPLPFLGNLWAAVWFVVRLPRLLQLLNPAPSAPQS